MNDAEEKSLAWVGAMKKLREEAGLLS